MDSYHASDMAQVGSELRPPFALSIGGNTDPVWQCDAVLRWLPGKRLVLALSRNEERCLCKLFFSRRDFRRELRGYRALEREHIPTPALLDHHDLPRGGHVLCYAYVAAPTLDDMNQRTPLSTAAPALRHTIGVVATMHRRGLRQVDIHPGNFLILDQTALVIDSAAVTSHRAPLPPRKARENLADLLAQFEPGQLEDLDGIWQEYCRHWPDQPNWSRTQLDEAVEKMRRLRWRHYRRKLTRACTEFGCQHNHRRFAVWHRSRDSKALQTTLQDPDATMAQGAALKRGNTATVDKVHLDGRELIIKRYNIKDWRHRLSRCWRPSRGWRSWHNAHYLLFSGLRTPQPVALLEERWGPLRGRAFFLSDFAPGPNLKQWLEQAAPAERADTLQALASLILRYHRAGISHGDMKADNFIVTADGVTIIDLDPMRHHRSTRALEQAIRRDVGRFLNNFEGASRDAIAAQLLPQLPGALRP